ncbi:MAG: patatin-like phospholipase family protein [Candidatus Margulisbacteria bacterium]|nr:patatin-like phospholipase family protein [Candidatus Margulisiibacteriota bacterium]
MDSLLLLRRLPLFSPVNLDDLRGYLERIEEVSFAKGDVICEQEKPSRQNLYIVSSGSLNMILNGRIIGTLAPLNIFGEASLFSGEPHSATIKAVSDGALLVIKRELFEEIGQKHPKVLINLSRNLGKKLHQTAEGVFKTSEEDCCRTILILSSVDMCGKSTLAVNLAASMYRMTGKRTLVLDTCFTSGSCASILKTSAPITLTDLVKEKRSFIMADLQKQIIKHSCGMDMFSFCREGENWLEEKEAICRAFKQLKLIYDLIIVDAPSGAAFGDLRHLFVESDEVVVLTKDSPTSINTGNKLLEAIKSIYPPLGSKIWAGFFPEKSGITVRIPQFNDFVFPYDSEIASAASISGIPFVIGYHNSHVSKAVNSLARKILHMRIGLALSSGMAHGLAHIGVLKVLQNAEIPVDIIAGTSGGALYASPFAAGRSLEHMEKAMLKIGKLKMFSLIDFSFPYSGFISGRRIIKLIRSVIGNINFEELSIPFLVISTDLNQGEIYIFSRGKVLEALRATISIPGVFPPYKHDGRFLVDGATISPVPVEILYRAGADKVIAVNTSAHPAGSGNGNKKGLFSQYIPPNFIDVIMHSRAISSVCLAESECRKADLTVSPELAGYRWRDYHLAKEIIKAGERAAEEALPKIRSLVQQGIKN